MSRSSLAAVCATWPRPRCSGAATSSPPPPPKLLRRPLPRGAAISSPFSDPRIRSPCANVIVSACRFPACFTPLTSAPFDDLVCWSCAESQFRCTSYACSTIMLACRSGSGSMPCKAREAACKGKHLLAFSGGCEYHVQTASSALERGREDSRVAASAAFWRLPDHALSSGGFRGVL